MANPGAGRRGRRTSPPARRPPPPRPAPPPGRPGGGFSPGGDRPGGGLAGRPRARVSPPAGRARGRGGAGGDVGAAWREGGRRPLPCSPSPPFLGDTDFGAAFLSAGGRTAAFLHYCGARWPATFFYCVSRRAGGGLLVTTDMREEAK